MPFNQTGNENLGKALDFMKEFNAEHLDEKICEIKALQWCTSLGFVACNYCDHNQIIPSDLQRMYLCKMCRKEIWITGGTFFDHVKKFRPYLASFYLLERGIILSACDLAKVLGVTSCTADRIYKKVTKLVSEKMKSSKIEVSTVELLPVTMRRTSRTPAGQPPAAEEAAVQKLLALQEAEHSEQESNYPEISNNEKSVLTLLSETPIRFADLCERLHLDCADAAAATMGLELRGLASRLPGDRYVILDQPDRPVMKAVSVKMQKSKHHELIKKMIDFINERFQGVGRKNHQLFAALFWIYEDRKRWGPGSIQQLCVQSRHIPYREILAFVTPPTVKLVTRAKA